MRYLRLLWLMTRVSLQTDAAYRGNFFFQVGGALMHLGAALLGLWVIFEQTTDLNGWGPWHMLALMGVFRIMTGVIALIIAPNMRQLMQDVRTGTLDFLLLQPVNSQFFASSRRIVAWRVIDILLGAIVAVIGAVKLGGGLPLTTVLSFLVMLAAGATVIYSVWLVLATSSFWLVRVANIEMVFWNVFEAARYPVTIFPPTVRWTLTYVLPVAFIVTVPAQALVGGMGNKSGVTSLTTATWIAAGVAAPASLAAATLFWRFGLRHYSGASA